MRSGFPASLLDSIKRSTHARLRSANMPYRTEGLQPRASCLGARSIFPPLHVGRGRGIAREDSSTFGRRRILRCSAYVLLRVLKKNEFTQSHVPAVEIAAPVVTRITSKPPAGAPHSPFRNAAASEGPPKRHGAVSWLSQFHHLREGSEIP